MNKKKVVLVVGGTGGIGAYIVEEFANAGYDVAFTYCNSRDKALAIEERIDAHGYRANMTEEETVVSLRETLDKDFGRLDALVYASGIFEDALVENMSIESWNRVIATNVTGAFLCAKYFIQMLRESGCGRFICTGSVMGESGIYGSCSYGASKAALIGLVKSIALENAKYNFTANVVSFGYIDAGMTEQLPEKVFESAMKKIPMKRAGNPVDSAKVIVDMCADHTNYISGQVIRINGLLYV